MLSSRSCASIAVISPCASRTSFGSGRSRSSDPRSKRRRRISFASSSIASSEGTTAAKRSPQHRVAVDDRLGLLVGQLRGAADDTVVELAPDDTPLGVELDHDRLRQPVLSFDEAADAARQRVRQHRQHGPGEVDGRAAKVGLLVEGAAFAHVVRDVGDVHGEPPAAAGPGLDPDRVVVVARRLRIDREGGPAAEVAARGGLFAADGPRDTRRLGLDLLGEGGRQVVLRDHDSEVDARVAQAAEHLGHAPHRVARRRRRPRDLDRDHLPRLGAALLTRGDEDLVQHAAVEGHEVAAETSVRLVAPDDAQVGPLEDADDPSLGAALAPALDPGDDTVAVERLADVRRGDEDVRLSLAPLVRDDEAVARRAARQPSDDEVHP